MPRTYLCTYELDNGTPVNVCLDLARADAASFSPGDLANGPGVRIHGKYLKLRGVWGRTPGGKKMFLPAPTRDALEALFIVGVFTVGVDEYVITGKRGEQDSVATVLP